MMKPRWIIAAVAAAALLFLAAGWASSGEPPKPGPTFSVAGLAVDGDVLVVRFKATYPSGMSGTWDPEAVKAAVARLVTLLNGQWAWVVYKPVLQGDEPIPPVVLIESFSLVPDTIKKGESAKLAWSCPKAKTVTVNGLPVATAGNQVLTPSVTTTYTLVATDGLKTETAQRILTVSDIPPPAELWGIVIEESSQRTPQQAVVLSSPAVRGLFREGTFRVVDKDVEVNPELKPYKERAVGQKLPMLFLVDKAGTVYSEGPLPATVAAMVALINKHKGGGK